MKFILFVLLAIPVGYILLLIVSAIFVNPKYEYTKDSPFYRWLLCSSTRIMVRLLRIRVNISGLEKLPEGRFLLVSNHRSNFDPILTWYAMEKSQLAFVSKAENFHIPIWGRIIRRCCFMAIDRENPRNALKTIEQAAMLMRENETSVCIYPEGTRSKQCVLLPFHAGVLKIAQKANVPIVVMTIEGTEKIHKNVPLRSSAVQLRILKTLDTAYVQEHRTTDLSNEIRNLMEESLPGTGDKVMGVLEVSDSGQIHLPE